MSLLLVALLGPATPPQSNELRATVIPAVDAGNVFVNHDRLYVVDAAPDRPAPARMAVRIAGTTHEDATDCDAAAGAVVCHLTDGPVAIWRF